MKYRIVFCVCAILGATPSAQALGVSDSLTAWREGSAIARMELATRFGKSFISVNEAFSPGYFLKCIDDISGYANAKEAKIEDAVRECVAARMRKPGDTDD